LKDIGEHYTMRTLTIRYTASITTAAALPKNYMETLSEVQGMYDGSLRKKM